VPPFAPRDDANNVHAKLLELLERFVDFLNMLALISSVGYFESRWESREVIFLQRVVFHRLRITASDGVKDTSLEAKAKDTTI